MKSILVDALRQASGEDTEKALSDSGSYDASNEDLGDTANDPGLELMSTHSALIVREPDGEPEEIEVATENEDAAATEIEPAGEAEALDVVDHDIGPVDDEHAMTIVGMQPLPLRAAAMPRLARLSPLLCLATAAAVAAMWFLLNATGTVGLGTAVPQPPANDVAPVTVFGETTRFPFLRPGEPIDVEEAVQ